MTGQEIREELERYGIIQVLGETDALAGGTNRLRDTIRLASRSLSATAYDGQWVRFSSGTNADGYQSRVDYLDPENGDLYFDPVVGAAPPDNSTYEIYAHGVNPDDCDRARDKALTVLCSQWALQPLTIIPNGDFETVVTDPGSADWQSDGTCAIATQSLSFPTEYARNSLLVTAASGADEYGESASMYVQPSEDFYLYVPVSARVGTAKLVVYDVTQSAAITLTGTATHTGRGWSGIEVTFVVPAGCYEITVRLTGSTGATDITEWGPVHLHRTNQRRIGLPARVIAEKRVGPIVFLNQPAITGTTDWGGDDLEEVTNVAAKQVRDSVQVHFEGKVMGENPHFFNERIYYTALGTAGYYDIADRTTGDAVTTLCDLQYVTAGMVRLLAEQYNNKPGQDTEFWAGLHAQALSRLEVYEREHGPSPLPRQELGRTITVPQPGI